MAKYWKMGLLRSMQDCENHIISSSLALVIPDKFPKAKYHFLVIPWADIDNIFELSTKDLSLLNEMYLLGLNVLEVKGLSKSRFQIGFHAHPSMHRLHLHVISKDFISNFMKTKKHWNSFNTQLFVHYHDLFKEISMNGSYTKFDKKRIKELLTTPLLCNQCALHPSNFQHLKFHLQEHEILDNSDDTAEEYCETNQ